MRFQPGFLATDRFRAVGREMNALLAMAAIVLAVYIAGRAIFPRIAMGDVANLTYRFVGPVWPFFAAVLIFVIYASAAWIVETTRIVVERRDWSGITRVLHWATEACPMVGLMTTFYGLLVALLAYGEEGGLGNPKAQAAFIEQFAIAFGSSIAGGILALAAFTLHRLIVDE